MQIKNGDIVYLIFDKRRKFLKTVKAGEKFHCDRGYIDFDDIIGKNFGTIIESKPYNHNVIILKPLPSDIILNLSRASQIIYPEDIGLILVYSGIQPGSIILEAGCGSGILTSIMAIHIQPNGHIYSFDNRIEAIKQTQKNIEKMGLQNYVTLSHNDIINDDISNIIQVECDIIMLDMATPWLAIPKIHHFLKNSGVCCCFSPVIEQVKKNHLALKANGFVEIETYELLKRKIQVREDMDATRPETRMIGHTGYITFGRKIEPYIEKKEKKEKLPTEIKNEHSEMVLKFNLDENNDK